MTVLAADFIVGYPEFAAIHAEDAGLIDAVLARAERRIRSDWEPADQRDDMVMLTAAVTLSKGPWGRNAALSGKQTVSEAGKESSYEAELKERKKAHAFARSRAV